jgi:hypothetical protein
MDRRPCAAHSRIGATGKDAMDQTMRVLALVAILLYITPRVFGDRISDVQRLWLWRTASAALAVGLVIALVETVRWFMR